LKNLFTFSGGKKVPNLTRWFSQKIYMPAFSLNFDQVFIVLIASSMMKVSHTQLGSMRLTSANCRA